MVLMGFEPMFPVISYKVFYLAITKGPLINKRSVVAFETTSSRLAQPIKPSLPIDYFLDAILDFLTIF